MKCPNDGKKLTIKINENDYENGFSITLYCPFCHTNWWKYLEIRDMNISKLKGNISDVKRRRIK